LIVRIIDEPDSARHQARNENPQTIAGFETTRLAVGTPPASSSLTLVCFHESVDRRSPALGADLEVVPVVWERLVAPLTSPNPRSLHLGNLFEQQPFQVFNQVSIPPFLAHGSFAWSKRGKHVVQVKGCKKN